jgi:putative ABC transport system permease protein
MWRTLVRGVRALVDPRAADRGVDDEIASFLEDSAAALESEGMTPADARREARRRWGHPIAIREQVRASGWEHAVATLAADLRYGARRLRRSPGFTLVAVATLALGIGASTTVFSAVNPILFAPLPYPDGDRIGVVLENGRADLSTFAMYRTLAARTHAFEALASMRAWQPAMTGLDVPERLEGQRVTAGYFRVLGVRPAIGRDFSASDDRPGAAAVAIIADSLWRRRLAADPSIVGRSVRLDDAPYTVIGVMARGFENVLTPAAEVWTPLKYDPQLPVNGPEWGHHLRTIVRLAAGETPASASREAHAAARAMLIERRPETYGPDTPISIATLHDTLTAGVRPVLLAMSGAVVLVLLIACVNVTNLLLARGAQRRGEFALRAALGAGRSRLVRQLLTESVLLALMSAAAGVGVALAGVRALAALAPAGLPRAAAIALDGQVLTFALTVATICGLAFGVLPALEAAGRDPRRDLEHVSHRTARGVGRLRQGLVAAEVALAFVLLVGAGLLMRSVRSVLAVPLGFETADRLTLQVPLVGRRYDQDAAALRFWAGALESVRRVPGVAAAAFTSQLPLSGDRDEYGAHFPAEAGRESTTMSVFRYAVGPGYFATIGTPILRGRAIDDRDRRDAPPVVVISASLAAARFGDADPIGHTLRVGPSHPYSIVGVAGDVHQLSLTATDANAVYIAAEQSWFADHSMSFVIRSRAGAPAPVLSVEQAVRAIDKDQPIVRVAALPALVAASAGERRFALVVFEAFAAAALVLAAIGIYGILAGAVAERAREIGVRTALGATRARIVALVLRQGIAMAAAGAVIGLAAASMASPALSALLFHVTPVDPPTYGAVAALLLAVSIAACVIPVWRALQVDPSTALRSD